jgi:hypothetical protein
MLNPAPEHANGENDRTPKRLQLSRSAYQMTASSTNQESLLIKLSNYL